MSDNKKKSVKKFMMIKLNNEPYEPNKINIKTIWKPLSVCFIGVLK